MPAAKQVEPLAIGLISDTHGLLRPEALTALTGCRLILHAGDVGDPQVLTRLAALAPVRAVRGNVDRGELAARLPASEVVELQGRLIYLLHDLGRLDLDPAVAGLAAVVYGHSHLPQVDQERGVLFVNPGSAGPARLGRPISVARLFLSAAGLHAELIELRC